MLWEDGRPRLSKAIREWLDVHADLSLPTILEQHPSEDGSTKVVLGLSDGHRIEAVHMPRDVKNPRVTLCISSQVGCAMGCAFCATATMGLRRHLTAGEIVGQVIVLLKELGPKQPHQITLVFMGMGEPLHNLKNVHRAIRVFNREAGLNISTKRITVSTSGLVSGILELSQMEPRPWLALSLNATTDEARSALMPVNKTHNMKALRRALDAWGFKDKEKLTVEYVLMDGVNDTPEDARRLAEWMGELRLSHNLNLIRMNAHDASPYQEPKDDALNAFVAELKKQGCFVTVRKSRGRDVKAACGQLMREGQD